MDRKPPERKSTIDKLHDELYSRQSGVHTDPAERTQLRREHEHTPHAWEDIHPPEPTSEPAASALHRGDVSLDRTLPEVVARKLGEHPNVEIMPASPRKPPGSHLALYFLGGALTFFIVALGAAAYLYLGGGNIISAQNIDFAISAPAIVDSGKPAVVQFTITNRNQETLQFADLVVQYPAGTRSATDQTQAFPEERIPLGDIVSGGQAIKTSSATFFGAEGAPQQIAATLEYRLSGSNAIFTKVADTSFVVGSSPVSVTLSAPDEAISGQPFNLDVTVGSNAPAPLANVALQAQFPFGFTLATADPSASTGGNLWRLGALLPGQSKTVHLTGSLIGKGGDARVFHFLAGTESDLSETSLAQPLLTQPLTIAIANPFLNGTIAISTQTGATASVTQGESAEGTIAWQNNLSQDVTDATFTLTLSGAYDQSAVTTNGFYDSSKHEIVWNSQTDSSLSDVPPGGRGIFSFSIGTLKNATTSPHVDLQLSISGTRAGQGSVPEEVKSAAQMRINLASAVTLMAQALHFTGDFQNSGPMPPQASQPTSYTIVWTVKNPSNDIGNGVVTATLPSSVTFGSARDSSVSYDDARHTVTWTLGTVSGGAGYGAAARTTSFQIILTPSINQIGQIPILTSSATFAGQDRFAGVAVSANVSALDGRLTGDPQFVQGMELVTGH